MSGSLDCSIRVECLHKRWAPSRSDKFAAKEITVPRSIKIRWTIENETLHTSIASEGDFHYLYLCTLNSFMARAVHVHSVPSVTHHANAAQ
jgi:hypothetical protein